MSNLNIRVRQEIKGEYTLDNGLTERVVPISIGRVWSFKQGSGAGNLTDGRAELFYSAIRTVPAGGVENLHLTDGSLIDDLGRPLYFDTLLMIYAFNLSSVAGDVLSILGDSGSSGGIEGILDSTACSMFLGANQGNLLVNGQDGWNIFDGDHINVDAGTGGDQYEIALIGQGTTEA